MHIEYLDQQFNVVFNYRGTSVSYLMIDRELHGRHSGFYGDMFPPEKLATAIERVAARCKRPLFGRASGRASPLGEAEAAERSACDKGKVAVSALSNARLKLTAPVVYGRIAFVNVKARRRSLGAVR